MKVEIELPKELEKYKDDFINYAMEAIEIKKAEDDKQYKDKALREKAEKKAEKVKINGKSWGQIKKERREKEMEAVE